MSKKTKAQMLNFQSQLEHIGIRLETISRLGFNTTNAIEDMGTEYINILQDLDMQQACNRYKWEGLPDYLTSQMIESMLYYKGSLAGFFQGGVLYVLPWTMSKGLNVYGQPNAIQPITFNGQMQGTFEKFGKELVATSLGNFNTNASASLLFDRVPIFTGASAPASRFVLNQELIRYEADILGRVKNNLRNTDKKVVFWVDSEAKKNQTEKDLDSAYGSNKPYIVAVRGSDVIQDREKSTTLQGDIANEIQSLFETWQSINSVRCMVLGITNGGAFEKKERKITGELQGDQTQTELVLDAGLGMRKLWLDQMKKIYPQYAEILGQISVKINRDEDLPEEYSKIDSSPLKIDSTGGDE